MQGCEPASYQDFHSQPAALTLHIFGSLSDTTSVISSPCYSAGGNPPQLHLTNLQIQFLWPFMANFAGSVCVDQSSSIGIELSAKLWHIPNVITKKESKSFREKIVFHQRSSVEPDAQHRDSWEGKRLPPVSD